VERIRRGDRKTKMTVNVMIEIPKGVETNMNDPPRGTILLEKRFSLANPV
jgi:hypothetical protein